MLLGAPRGINRFLVICNGPSVPWRFGYPSQGGAVIMFPLRCVMGVSPLAQIRSASTLFCLLAYRYIMGGMALSPTIRSHHMSVLPQHCVLTTIMGVLPCSSPSRQRFQLLPSQQWPSFASWGVPVCSTVFLSVWGCRRPSGPKPEIQHNRRGRGVPTLT